MKDYPELNLYPEMNREIVNILRLPPHCNPMNLYAAQLIETQAKRIEALERAIKEEDAKCISCIHYRIKHHEEPCVSCRTQIGFGTNWEFDIDRYSKPQLLGDTCDTEGGEQE